MQVKKQLVPLFLRGDSKMTRKNTNMTISKSKEYNYKTNTGNSLNGSAMLTLDYFDFGNSVGSLANFFGHDVFYILSRGGLNRLIPLKNWLLGASIYTAFFVFNRSNALI